MASFQNTQFRGPLPLSIGHFSCLFTLGFALIAEGTPTLEWWGAAALGAQPNYTALDLPRKLDLSNSKPVFDVMDRLWLGGDGDLLRHDGMRWDRWNEGILTIKDLDRQYGLLVANTPKFGFIPLDSSGNPIDEKPHWIQDDFPPRVLQFEPWFAQTFPGAPGIFWVLGSEIWHWNAGQATPLLIEPNGPILYPIEWRGHWHYAIDDGTVWRMESTGAQLAFTTSEMKRPLWIRDNHDDPSIVEVVAECRLRLSAHTQESFEDPTLFDLVDAGWWVGASTAPAGWTVSLSHMSDFVVHPADDWSPLRFAPPLSRKLSEQKNPIALHRFDLNGNLWINSAQGLFRWENPGRTWRWMQEKNQFAHIKPVGAGLLVQAWSGVQFFDFEHSSSRTMGYEGEILFDAIALTPERILGASRRYILNFQSPNIRSDQMEEDIKELRPIQDDEEQFLAFGTKTVFLGQYPASDRSHFKPLLELNGVVQAVVADGLRFDYIFADGSIQRLQLIRTDDGSYRLGSVSAIRSALGAISTCQLIRWGEARLTSSSEGISLITEVGTLEPLKQFANFEILQLAEAGDNRALVVARPNDRQQLIFAFLEGEPSADVNPQFFWYPGTIEVGAIRALAWEPQHKQIFLGGSDSLISFDEGLLRPLETLPTAHLEVSRDGGHRWNQADLVSFELPYGDSQLRFRWFHEEWFAHPPMRYQSRVGGLEASWTAVANDERELTGLREGRYTFMTRVVDPRGEVHQELAFSFRILPPWYRSNGAYSAYAILLISGISLSFRFYSYRARVQREYLEITVRKRTAELEEANTAKAQFVANMSHELRNPMNGMAGLTELLERSGLHEDQSRLVKTLRACTEQLSRMINDVLDFAKIEAGKLALDKRPFNAPSMVAQAIEVVSWDATQSSHHIVQETVGNAPFLVIGDDSKISQILINFLSNACKYSEPGTVILRAHYHPGLRNRLQMRFEVEDEGPGMTQEERSHVFERFYRSPKAANSPIRGSGLGLAVCTELAELMGGKIGVLANKRGGSTFFFEVALPLPEGSEHATNPVDYETTYMGTVLVVDDMDYNRLVAAGILESLGFTVTSVSDGSEAIACLLAADYDFAFIDYELPDTTGPEILQTARKEKPGFRTKCFAVTAYAGDEKRKECTAAGFIGFVTKPISRLRMREALISSGLKADELARGTYQQPIADSEDHTYDLEPLLILSGGSMAKLMGKCEEFLSILENELDETRTLLETPTSDLKSIAKRLHRLTSHGSIVKAHRFLDSVDELRRVVKEESPEAWLEAADRVDEKRRELAINLRRVVDEYRSRA